MLEGRGSRGRLIVIRQPKRTATERNKNGPIRGFGRFSPERVGNVSAAFGDAVH